MDYNSLVYKENGSIQVTVDPCLFCSEAILKTAYLFTSQCHINVAANEEKATTVVFRSKVPEVNADKVVHEFLNELIDQQLRVQVQRQTADLQRLIVSEAFAPLDSQEK